MSQVPMIVRISLDNRIVPPRHDFYPYIYFQVWEWSPKFECFKWVDITSTVAKLKQKRLVKA